MTPARQRFREARDALLAAQGDDDAAYASFRWSGEIVGWIHTREVPGSIPGAPT